MELYVDRKSGVSFFHYLFVICLLGTGKRADKKGGGMRWGDAARQFSAAMIYNRQRRSRDHD